MDPKVTVLTALPLVLIITVLAAIVVFSGKTSFDIRPKAAVPAPTIARVNPYASPIQIQPQTACSDLYQPVCGEDDVTYENLCEAQNKKATVAYYTACVSRDLPTAE